MHTSSVRASAADPPRRQAARGTAVWLLLQLLLGLGNGCGGRAAPNTAEHSEVEVSRSDPLDFSFPGVDAQGVSSATTRGRVTALLFVTTYDMASQLTLRRLADVIVRFVPRTNAAAVVLEAPRYAELLPAYRDSLQLPFPVVMADFATLQGQGPFSSIQHVPTLVILDRAGREVARRQGAWSSAEIEAELARASRR